MEQNAYKIVYKNGQGEVIEKKSRFIAHVFPIATEEDALQHIEELKKQYFSDSTCICYLETKHYMNGKEKRTKFSS